ncbi:MAG: hypothetical protein Q9168_005971 [Polycauliona sp. 1 TL-2023]
MDLRPGTPTQVQARRPAICDEPETGDPYHPHLTDATCQASQLRDPNLEDNIHCDLFYGQPSGESCDAAIKLIEQEVKDPIFDNREFLPQGVSPAFTGFPLERTPQNYPPDAKAIHDCTIGIDLAEEDGTISYSSDLENWDYLWGRANEVIEKCVKGLGVGGWTSAGKFLPGLQVTSLQWLSDILIGEQYNGMRVSVYGPLSRYAKFQAIQYTCETDGLGSAQCDSDGPPDPKRQKTGPGDVSSGAGASSNAPSAPVAEGAPCYKPSDCDAANNYICATDKSLPGGGTTSWGTFSCRYFPTAGSIVAALATTVRTGHCHGRCILGANDTVEIPSSDTAPIAPFANTLSMTLEPSLSCPCNCTYVSHACCLSADGIVAESAPQEIITTQLPPNSSVCCDGNTGIFAERSVVVNSVSKENALCPT